ncbi:SigmaK-factor processing regulatory protein BofA [Halovivax ruber XH-70]|uniref:SigmaK-factor processing regulatory protein BofA n=1 Tax=Halovivax ruber (strain DSM 18193 / JCM 13892 / XH-70) TaxID=797302 RepID=L0IDD8_HALRX|nr:pro-sigmaK processing inhibitor BofA family protein [Halovivax ruber]AGB17575.1 SigmaK-factor processing regulatory protein BofA [Halovivax ruber XH-70]
MVSLTGLVINAVVGLVLLVLANVLGLGVQISILTLLICGILGIPGAILVIALALLDIAFMATMVPLVPL